jgi:hypothetical protein
MPLVALDAGLQGDGNPSTPLRVDFGGTGAASTVARSDHTHAAAFTFDCVPPWWTYNANAVVCSTTLVLARPSIASASVNGHWYTSGNWCTAEIAFASEPLYFENTAASPFAFKDAVLLYPGGSPSPISITRSIALPAGTHTVRYGVSLGTAGAGCSIYGSSMHGFVIPQ